VAYFDLRVAYFAQYQRFRCKITGSALKLPGYFKTQKGCMPTGKVKMFNEEKGFGFIRPDDGGADIFFHVSALREGDEITEGKAVSFETGPDPKSGKIKAMT